jgi:hypothetical protein
VLLQRTTARPSEHAGRLPSERKKRVARTVTMVNWVNAVTALGAATVSPDGSSAVVDGPAAVAAASSASSSTNTCPYQPEVVFRSHNRFHGDHVCDRDGYNSFKDRLNRHERYQFLKTNGNHARIPNAKTVSCPAVVQDLAAPDQVAGLDTSWIVENTASSPVVLSFVKDGVERSAVNTNISPPEDDPRAVLKPGEWKAINTYDGHVFHAREILPDGTTGKVLLQHRVGMIPIGEKASRNLVCPDVDDEPTVLKDDGTKVTHPNFQRTKAPPKKVCNTIEVSFRNMAGCPLNGYYVQAGTCQETFKHHLGVQTSATDFMKDWGSSTKYESSYVGHTFVFRSAFSDLVVDKVTIRPTQITDCPDLKQTVATALSTSAILLPTANRLRNNNSNASNNTTTTAFDAFEPMAGSSSSSFSMYAFAAGGSI